MTTFWQSLFPLYRMDKNKRKPKRKKMNRTYTAMQKLKVVARLRKGTIRYLIPASIPLKEGRKSNDI